MERNEFEQDLHIDPEQLDVECAMQGELYFKWAEKSVEARKTMDRAKFNMEVVGAVLASKIRKNPDKYKLEKATADAVKATVDSHKDYKGAQDAYLDARADQTLLEQAVMAMEHKRRMLVTLVQLHGQEYFAGPAVPRSLTDAYTERKKERSKEVVKKTKIRKRK